MTDDFSNEIERLGITRLCHFTPFLNLIHILAPGGALTSTTRLKDDARAVYRQQDLQRYDQQEGHVCLSIEYPNAWYLAKKKLNASHELKLASTWVCLGIEPELIARDDTLFCPYNASGGWGSGIKAGFDAFKSLYADEIVGSNWPVTRAANQIPACPTDNQAEVLVANEVAQSEIKSVICATLEELKLVYYGLKQVGTIPKDIKFAYAPVLFEKYPLKKAIRSGQPPAEIGWSP